MHIYTYILQPVSHICQPRSALAFSDTLQRCTGALDFNARPFIAAAITGLSFSRVCVCVQYLYARESLDFFPWPAA